MSSKLCGPDEAVCEPAQLLSDSACKKDICIVKGSLKKSCGNGWGNSNGTVPFALTN